MKKAVLLLFSLSVLLFATPEKASNSNSYDLAQTTIQKGEPIYPPIG